MGGLNITHKDKTGKTKGEIRVYRDTNGGHKEFIDGKGKILDFRKTDKNK